MPTLDEYYLNLLLWEKRPFQELVHAWPEELATQIEAAFAAAVVTSALKGSICPTRQGSTNQSMGNQVENHAITKLAGAIRGFALTPCAGPGYPDRCLEHLASKLQMPLEVKATAGWDPSDSARRVLTSSSEKLRLRFGPRIHHLLLTILYSMTDDRAKVDHLRLDFLEPETTVTVRLEASVSHKILAHAPHRSLVL